MHYYSEDEVKYLRKISPGRTNKEITKMFNEKFNLQIGEKAIEGTRKRYKAKNGLTTTFEKGLIPWNKGTKGLTKGGEATRFKKGNRPYNYRPVGSKRITKDGYEEIKVADPGKWKAKHHMVWEEHNGPVPKNHAVIFGDGNIRNFDIDNLILVSRQQLLILNRHKLIQDDADLTRTAVIVANIYQKIGEMKKK